MKTPLALLLATFLGSLALHGQNDEAPKEDLAPWQQEFLNLPADRRTEFTQHLEKARELFAQKRIFETIDQLSKAEAIFENSPDLYNTLGACQVEFRDFDEAMELFNHADRIHPGSPNILFNIAEIQFVTGKWSEAAASFRKILGMIGQDESSKAMARLIEFKLLLCNIKLGNIDVARAMAEKYDYLDDSPYPYYAEAAIDYYKDETVAAEAAIARARRIFQTEAVLSPWQDTLMEFGYLPSFFSRQLEEDADE